MHTARKIGIAVLLLLFIRMSNQMQYGYESTMMPKVKQFIDKVASLIILS